jgi:hypothetical protein
MTSELGKNPEPLIVRRKPKLPAGTLEGEMEVI